MRSVVLASNRVYKNDVYLLPKQLDVLVASLHLPSFGAALTVFAQGGYSVLHCFFNGQPHHHRTVFLKKFPSVCQDVHPTMLALSCY